MPVTLNTRVDGGKEHSPTLGIQAPSDNAELRADGRFKRVFLGLADGYDIRRLWMLYAPHYLRQPRGLILLRHHCRPVSAPFLVCLRQTIENGLLPGNIVLSIRHIAFAFQGSMNTTTPITFTVDQLQAKPRRDRYEMADRRETPEFTHARPLNTPP
jgi:hypothetical protein